LQRVQLAQAKKVSPPGGIFQEQTAADFNKKGISAFQVLNVLLLAEQPYGYRWHGLKIDFNRLQRGLGRSFETNHL
jgi:hypothetical protein